MKKIMTDTNEIKINLPGTQRGIPTVPGVPNKSDAHTPGTIEMGKGVIVLTYGCNLRCSFCYAAAEVFDKPSSMSRDEGFKSMEFMSSIGIKTLTLLGGEPTLYKHLPDMVEYGTNLGVSSWIVTNGFKLALSDLGNELLDRGLKGGCISLHGHTPEEHDTATKKKGSYDIAMRAVNLAVENNWPFYPMVTVMERNLDNVLPLITALSDVGCELIYINYGLPSVSEDYNIGGDASPEALALLSQELYHLQKPLGVKFIFNREKNKVPLCHFDYDTLNQMFEEEIIGTGCEAAQGNTIVVEPGGSALGCSHWVEHPLLNIYKNYENLELLSPEEFWKEWNHGEPAQYRDSLSYFPYEKCEDCGWRKSGKCFGGCKVWQKAGVLPKYKKFDPIPATPHKYIVKDVIS